MKMLLFDANSIVNRAYYAIRPLTTKEGLHTNGIFGFFNILLKFIADENPDYIVCAFDVKAPTFRHQMYADYKAGRRAMPDELVMQIPVLKELLDSMQIARIEQPGYEADDIIGTLSARCEQQNVDCVIVTGDRDSLQLVSGLVTVKLAVSNASGSSSVLYDTAKIKEDYGVSPPQMIDIKAIMGDSSDNVPGVRGIGEKGAIDLISRYHNIEYIFDHFNELDIKPGIRAKLEQGKDSAFMSKTLVTIDRAMPLDSDMESLRYSGYDNGALYELLTRLEFNVFIKRLGLSADQDSSGRTAQILENPDLQDLQEQISLRKKMVYLSEDGSYKNLLILSDGQVCKVSSAQPGFSGFARSVFQDAGIEKCTSNAKAVIVSLLADGIDCQNLAFDAQIAAYILNPSLPSYELPALLRDYLKVDTSDAAVCCTCLEELRSKLEGLIAFCNCEYLYREIELKLVSVLANMEFEGFGVDRSEIEAFGRQLDIQLEALENEIYSLSERRFNINSPKQLGEVLFETLQLPHSKKTKTGYSTSVEVLEKLRPHHPIIDLILRYRQSSKLKGTYVDGLLKVIGPDGRIHTTFQQTVTATGRISSTEPNLQNIPVRSEQGREIRKMFVAREGYTLLDSDYSQIELRVLAHISRDKEMIEAFAGGNDIHTQTASGVFGVPPIMVTPEMRRRSKAVNFGIVYGIGEYSLSQDLNISVKEAKTYIDNYLRTYSGVEEYMRRTVEQAKSDGFVTTLFGRRRYIPEISSTNYNIRSFGERVAMNAPIQGSAADIIKIAMIRVFDRLKKENLRSKLILQVHDELIIEAVESEKETVSILLQQEMQNAAKLTVPLEADVSEGRTWYLAKS